VIQFIYSGESYNREREQVIENLTNIVASLVALPEQIEIEFKKLNGSIYGETILDPRFPNRIRLSDSLSTKTVIRPLVHELLHLNQTHTGKLSIRRDGTYVWEGRFFRVDTSKVTVEEWAKLPWEQDVANSENYVLQKALALGIARSP
jgi:hypothetical protein